MMYNQGNWGWGMMGWGMMPFSMGWFAGPLILLALWSLFWKGLGLWHASGRRQPWWFVIIFLVNTFGILELIYLFAVIKLKPGELFKK